MEKMMKFRKKPVVIEAMQLHDADPDQWCEVLKWIGEDACAVGEGFEPHIIQIRTLEGLMFADPHDWIIKGVKGEFYPCKPDIFEATYEPVE
jgi:hypothetical protein